jgi:hypothetical protein
MKTKLKKNRFYVGFSGEWCELFQSRETPTNDSHGHLYHKVMGPFSTKAGAKFYCRYGKNNPHCNTVAQAEKLAKQCCNQCGKWMDQTERGDVGPEELYCDSCSGYKENGSDNQKDSNEEA